MNTRLMFVPPELATSSVSGLFETNMPHGSEPTATPLARSPSPCVVLCQTSSRLKAVFERNTLPRAASTAMSPIVPCVRQRVRAAVDDERRVDERRVDDRLRRSTARRRHRVADATRLIDRERR